MNIRFEDWEAEQMQDPEFRAAVEALEPAYQEARRQVIDQLPAGRETDVLVARNIFGWTRLDEFPSEEVKSYDWGAPTVDAVLHIVPHYSTDIAAAWEIITKVPAAFFLEHPLTVGNSWCARFEDRGDGTWQDEVVVRAMAPTAPLAICRAALKFVDARAHRLKMVAND